MSFGNQLRAFAYVDGGYLRKEGQKVSTPFPNPRMVVNWTMGHIHSIGTVILRRTSFYDADCSESESDPDLASYWQWVDGQFDTDLRFGELRGKPRRQKGVDVLLAVDMLSGASNRLFDVAILIAGDADFVPLVREVRRCGITVVVAGVSGSTSEDLQRESDRFVTLDSVSCPALLQEPFVRSVVT